VAFFIHRALKTTNGKLKLTNKNNNLATTNKVKSPNCHFTLKTREKSAVSAQAYVISALQHGARLAILQSTYCEE
jgi:hypothetical protein